MQNDFENWELDKLSDYIVDTHHTYVRSMIPAIQKNSDELAQKHATQYPETLEIKDTFNALAKALEEHLAGEEKYLFPYIKKMLNAKREGSKLPKPGFGSIDKPLQHHYEEHDHATELMKKINALSKSYHLPENACDTHVNLYAQLSEFEKDLEQHIYLENDVLFGKSIELEKQVVE